ncbi:hypothetical protein [Psychrobacter phenylpyruvicus]|nr:hypothetical protein [Psychrobacter phenylpyruvicus]
MGFVFDSEEIARYLADNMKQIKWNTVIR